MTENTPDAVKVLERLIATARLLYANAEGCALNHHGADFELHGMPGWLTDCAADIAAAQSLGARATAAEAEAAALRVERDAWRSRESETQEALQKIGEEFGIHGGEPRTDGVRRILTKMRDGLNAIANAYTAHGYSDAMDAVQSLKDIAKEALK